MGKCYLRNSLQIIWLRMDSKEWHYMTMQQAIFGVETWVKEWWAAALRVFLVKIEHQGKDRPPLPAGVNHAPNASMKKSLDSKKAIN